MAKEKCFNCRHDPEPIEPYQVTPQNSGIKGFPKLCSYFQYKAPLIDSAQAVQCNWTNAEQDIVLEEMLRETKMNNRCDFKKSIKKNTLESLKLERKDAVCFMCQRAICRLDKDETELRSLLRHLRNSIARLYLRQEKEE